MDPKYFNVVLEFVSAALRLVQFSRRWRFGRNLQITEQRFQGFCRVSVISKSQWKRYGDDEQRFCERIKWGWWADGMKVLLKAFCPKYEAIAGPGSGWPQLENAPNMTGQNMFMCVYNVFQSKPYFLDFNIFKSFASINIYKQFCDASVHFRPPKKPPPPPPYL